MSFTQTRRVLWLATAVELFSSVGVYKWGHVIIIYTVICQCVSISSTCLSCRLIAKATWGYFTSMFTLNTSCSKSQTLRNKGVAALAPDEQRENGTLVSNMLTLPKAEVPWISVTCRHRWVMTHLGNEEQRQKRLDKGISPEALPDSVSLEVVSWIDQKQNMGKLRPAINHHYIYIDGSVWLL